MLEGFLRINDCGFGVGLIVLCGMFLFWFSGKLYDFSIGKMFILLLLFGELGVICIGVVLCNICCWGILLFGN